MKATSNYSQGYQGYGNKKRISKNRALIVDDDKISSGLLELFFQKIYKVELAANGEEAWEKIKTNKFDLIISDMTMPKMGGVELFRKVKEMNPDIAERFVFVTGLEGGGDTDYLLQNHLRVYPKPIRISHLIEISDLFN